MPTEECAASHARPSDENALARTCPDQFVMVGCEHFLAGRCHDKIRKIGVQFRIHGITNRAFCHGKKVGRNTVNLGGPVLRVASRLRLRALSILTVITRRFQKRAPLRFVMSFRISCTGRRATAMTASAMVARGRARSSCRHDRLPEGGSAGCAETVIKRFLVSAGGRQAWPFVRRALVESRPAFALVRAPTPTGSRS